MKIVIVPSSLIGGVHTLIFGPESFGGISSDLISIPGNTAGTIYVE